MSRWRNPLRGRRGADHGFTLIELVVAIAVVALAAAGTVPLLIAGLQAALASELNTQAKNLAQQRFESMRDLQFHVDRQNGPFVDLLDIYYTNLSTTPTSHSRANEVEVGHWVAGGATSPHPAGAFYEVTVAALPGHPTFSQTIDMQFLQSMGAAMPSSALTGYDSQTEGHDQPPSLLVGVTVITTWSDHGRTHSYTSYSRIADGRGLVSSLTSQASGELLRVSSTGSAGNALTVDVAAAEASGSQSTGSTATADVRALQAVDAAGTDYVGAAGLATSPTSGGSLNSPVAAFTAAGSGDCGWVGAGPTQVTDTTAATTSGLPQVPSDVDTANPPIHQLSAQLTSGGNSACGIFGFSNQSPSYSSALQLAGDVPLVRIANDPQNNVVASGTAWVNASPMTTLPHSVTSGASASATKRVQVFPGAGFVTDGFGIVDVRISQASISCASSVSNGIATPTASASWNVTVDYWKATDTFGHGQRVTLPTYTWDSGTGTGSADPLAAIDPATIIVYQNGATTLRLSDYIASWSTDRSIVENSASGVHQLSGVVAISTQPVRDGDVLSAVGLQIGNLSCVADDER